MIVYLDASALVKRYVAEAGSPEVRKLIYGADAVGTSVVSRAETAAALARAVRSGILKPEGGRAALRAFEADWESLIRVQMTESLAARAGALAWAYGLRGYDAVHLASAVFWREALAEPVTLATFDRELWKGAGAEGLAAWPEGLG